MTSTHRQSPLTLLARTSFKLGEFKLSSGAHQRLLRASTAAPPPSTPRADASPACALILDLIHHHKLKPAAIGGLTMGADPIVSNVASASAWHAQKVHGAPLIHGFLVRKAEKTHGTARRIEGFFEKDAPVIIVDDVCTTGASTITAIEAAKETGMNVIAAICLSSSAKKPKAAPPSKPQ